MPRVSKKTTTRKKTRKKSTLGATTPKLSKVEQEGKKIMEQLERTLRKVQHLYAKQGIRFELFKFKPLEESHPFRYPRCSCSIVDMYGAKTPIGLSSDPHDVNMGLIALYQLEKFKQEHNK